MPNNSTCTIACALCVGDAPELYLSAALASIADAVDALVVNDNARGASSANVATLEASVFAQRSALRIARHPFRDFADMRNRAFQGLARLPSLPQWVLFLDADEIHGGQLRYLTREILPRLDSGTVRVDAYTYHFYGTFRWISDVARRFVCYRYRPDLRWENAVHERIVGLHGRTLVLPYVYHHYGNAVPAAMLARKHVQYFELGNAVPQPPSVAEANRDIYLARADRVRPYRHAHPHAARATLDALEAMYAEEFALIDAGFAARRTAAVNTRTTLQSLNEALRVSLRRVQHPGLFRAPSRAT